MGNRVPSILSISAPSQPQNIPNSSQTPKTTTKSALIKSYRSGPDLSWHIGKDRLITNHGAKSMKTTLLAIFASLTCTSASASYHLSTLPQQSESQKNLIAILNIFTGAGATAFFRLLTENEKYDPTNRPKPSANLTPTEPTNSLPPVHPNLLATATLAQSPSNPPSSTHPQPIENAPTTPASGD
jgi:hypothetical protein